MLSRVANSIYWINRLIERAENYARFIDVNFNLTLDLPPGCEEQWQPLIMTTGDSQLFLQKYDEYTKENVINFLSFDPDNPNSIVSCLTIARENARSVREVIPSEMWQQLNQMYVSVKDMFFEADLESGDLSPFFKKIILGSHLFSGVMDATFSRTEGWHFGNLGRFMERSDKIARIIDMKYYYLLPVVDYVGTAFDLLQWSALLRSASAFEMYRKVYGKLEVHKIVDFLVLNMEFPRSIHYSLVECERSLHAISGTSPDTFTSKAEKTIGRLRSDLDYTDINDIFHNKLHDYINDYLCRLNEAGSSIYETYFV